MEVLLFLARHAANLMFGLVCLCGALVATLWAVQQARYQLRRFNVVWQHEASMREAIAEWRERHPERVLQLQQMREQLDD